MSGASLTVHFAIQSGPDLTSEDTWGVNYRALRDLFQLSKARLDVIKYDVAVQMIEIYNEQVRDLLVSDGSTRRYPFNIFFLHIVGSMLDLIRFVTFFLIQELILLVGFLLYCLNCLHIRYTKQPATEWSQCAGCKFGSCHMYPGRP